MFIIFYIMNIILKFLLTSFVQILLSTLFLNKLFIFKQQFYTLIIKNIKFLVIWYPTCQCHINCTEYVQQK